MTLDERNDRNVVCVEFLESSTVILHDPQHLYLATIQVVMNVNSCTEGSLTCARNDDQTRRVLSGATHSSRQLIQHFNVEDVERRPVKNQPEDILTETNMQVRHKIILRFCIVYVMVAPCGRHHHVHNAKTFYRPAKVPLRFSILAAIPSLASSLWKH